MPYNIFEKFSIETDPSDVLGKDGRKEDGLIVRPKQGQNAESTAAALKDTGAQKQADGSYKIPESGRQQFAENMGATDLPALLKEYKANYKASGQRPSNADRPPSTDRLAAQEAAMISQPWEFQDGKPIDPFIDDRATPAELEKAKGNLKKYLASLSPDFEKVGIEVRGGKDKPHLAFTVSGTDAEQAALRGKLQASLKTEGFTLEENFARSTGKVDGMVLPLQRDGFNTLDYSLISKAEKFVTAAKSVPPIAQTAAPDKPTLVKAASDPVQPAADAEPPKPVAAEASANPTTKTWNAQFTPERWNESPDGTKSFLRLRSEDNAAKMVTHLEKEYGVTADVKTRTVGGETLYDVIMPKEVFEATKVAKQNALTSEPETPRPRNATPNAPVAEPETASPKAPADIAAAPAVKTPVPLTDLLQGKEWQNYTSQRTNPGEEGLAEEFVRPKLEDAEKDARKRIKSLEDDYGVKAKSVKLLDVETGEHVGYAVRIAADELARVSNLPPAQRQQAQPDDAKGAASEKTPPPENRTPLRGKEEVQTPTLVDKQLVVEDPAPGRAAAEEVERARAEQGLLPQREENKALRDKEKAERAEARAQSKEPDHDPNEPVRTNVNRLTPEAQAAVEEARRAAAMKADSNAPATPPKNSATGDHDPNEPVRTNVNELSQEAQAAVEEARRAAAMKADSNAPAAPPKNAAAADGPDAPAGKPAGAVKDSATALSAKVSKDVSQKPTINVVESDGMRVFAPGFEKGADFPTVWIEVESRRLPDVHKGGQLNILKIENGPKPGTHMVQVNLYGSEAARLNELSGGHYADRVQALVEIMRFQDAAPGAFADADAKKPPVVNAYGKAVQEADQAHGAHAVAESNLKSGGYGTTEAEVQALQVDRQAKIQSLHNFRENLREDYLRSKGLEPVSPTAVMEANLNSEVKTQQSATRNAAAPTTETPTAKPATATSSDGPDNAPKTPPIAPGAEPPKTPIDAEIPVLKLAPSAETHGHTQHSGGTGHLGKGSAVTGAMTALKELQKAETTSEKVVAGVALAGAGYDMVDSFKPLKKAGVVGAVITGVGVVVNGAREYDGNKSTAENIANVGDKLAEGGTAAAVGIVTIGVVDGSVLYQREKERKQEHAELGGKALEMLKGERPVNLKEAGKIIVAVTDSGVKDVKAGFTAVRQGTVGQVIEGKLEISAAETEIASIALKENFRFKAREDPALQSRQSMQYRLRGEIEGKGGTFDDNNKLDLSDARNRKAMREVLEEKKREIGMSRFVPFSDSKTDYAIFNAASQELAAIEKTAAAAAKIVRNFDKNGDGEVDATEAQKLTAKQIGNGDKTIDRKEMQALKMAIKDPEALRGVVANLVKDGVTFDKTDFATPARQQVPANLVAMQQTPPGK